MNTLQTRAGKVQHFTSSTPLHRRDFIKLAASAAVAGIQSAAAFGGRAAPSHIKDDFDALEGFTDDEDALFTKKLELEDLVKGYPDEK